MERMKTWKSPVTMKDVEPLKTQCTRDYVYQNTASGVELLRCSHVGEKLLLPDQISNRWVTSIAAGALSNCGEMIGAVLPGSLRSIGDYAFFQCEKLRELRIPRGVQAIGDGAFAGCTGLESLYVPPSVQSIGKDAFEGAANLTLTGEEDSAIHRYAQAHGMSFVRAEE